MPNHTDRRERTVHGVKLRSVNGVMIAVTAVIHLLLLLLTLTVYQNHRAMEEATRSYISCEVLADELRSGSDYMTEQVRYYAVTGEARYARAYFTEVNVTRRRDRALEGLMAMDVDDSLKQELSAALQWSNDLMEIELRSMRLTAEANGADPAGLPGEIGGTELSAEDAALSRERKQALGRDLVFDDTYAEYKLQIYTHLNALAGTVLERTQDQLAASSESFSRSLSRQNLMIALLFMVNLVMFALIVLAVIRPLGRYIVDIEQDTPFDEQGVYEFKYLARTYNRIYQLRYYAEHDKLTGLLNRTAFETLVRYLTENHVPTGLMILDVDHFKEVNDTYGHQVGDAALRRVADLLQRGMRPTDKVIRYGGDEFVVIMPRTGAAAAADLRARVDGFNQILLRHENGVPPLSVSAGVAFAERGYDGDIFRRADAALYRAKRAGRGTCAVAREGDAD